MRRLITALLLAVSLAHAGTSDTANPIPQQNATFLPDLQNFLRKEDANRYAEQFQSFVVTGCLGTTVASLTHTPSPCLAYPGGYRTKETGSVSYPNASVCWVIVHKDTFANYTSPGGIAFTRVPNTHYLTNCTAAAPPDLPANSALLMRVTTGGGAITAVLDFRERSPIDLRVAGTQGAGAENTNCLSPARVCSTNPVPNGTIAPAVTITTAETTLATVTVTTHGGVVLLAGTGAIRCVSTNLTTMLYRIKRGATTIFTVEMFCGGIAADVVTTLPLPTYFDAPATGSYIYTLTAQGFDTTVITTPATNTGKYFAAEVP